MKVSEFLEVVLRLFNDLIGAVVPGFLLMTGLVFLHTESFVDAVTARLPSSDWAVVLVVATSYASGHLLLAMASIFADGFKKLEEEKLFEGIVNYVRKLVKLEASSSEMAAEQHVRKLVEAQIRSSYEKNGGEGNSFSPLTFNELRNIAMTLRPEASALGYRFMSISLFCTGLGTAFCVVSLDAVVGSWLYASSLRISGNTEAYWLALVLFMAALALFRRAAEFRIRARQTPFSVALTALLFPVSRKQKDD